MEDLIERIYRAMALTVGDIDTEVVDSYLSDWLTVFPDNECLALHNTVISLYEYLIRSSAAGDAIEGVLEKEKEGKVEVEYAERDTGDNTAMWQAALDSYLNAPWSAFPTCRTELSTGITNRVKVGGVHEDEIQEINCDPNQRTGGADEICGVKSNSFARRGKFGRFC